VKNTVDLDEIVADAINRQKGKARKDKLAGAWLRPGRPRRGNWVRVLNPS
jgi:hypothetical protein